MTQSIYNKVISRIYGNKRGWIFTPANFLDLGSRSAIDQILVRLVKSCTIRRLARGLYDYPEIHPDFGYLPPNYERIAQALVRRDNIKIQSSGAYAANMLGLTDQVPAKIVYLTDGHSRTVQVGKLNIKLKKTTPKNMATAGRISGLVFQALRYMGQENVDDRVINILKRKLSDKDKKTLMADLRYAPAWIDKVLRRLNENRGVL